MFRAEQLTPLAGAIALERDREGGPLRVVNDSELELRDAVLIDVNGPGPVQGAETRLGTIAPGTTVAVADRREGRSPVNEGLDPGPFLKELRTYVEDRPEDRGEIRLVGWTPHPQGGLKLAPAVDRHRGFSVVVVHLRIGPPPAPDGPIFNNPEVAGR
jgi:hypothetical protein